MSYELQLSSSIFSAIVRRRLAGVVPCLDEQIDTPLGPLVIDHVAIAPETSIQPEHALDPMTLAEVPAATQNAWIFSLKNYTSIQVPFMQVKQALDVVLVTPSSLEAAGTEPSVPVLTLRVHVVLNVSAHVAHQSQGGSENVTLVYAFAYIDPGSARSFVNHAQLEKLKALLAGVVLPSTTVDLSQLAGLAGQDADARIVNAGIACDPAGTRVALRLEADIYRSPVRIGRAFFTVGPQDHLEGSDWAFLVDEDVIVANVAATAREALQNQAKIRLRSGPAVSWSPGTASVVTTARIEAVDACPFFVEDIDMDVDVKITVSFFVPADDQLQTTFRIEGSPADFGEVLGCAVTASLLWPFIAPILLSREENSLDAFATYFVGMVVPPLLRVAAIIFAIETKTLSEDVSDDLGNNCQKIDDETYVCIDNVDLLIPIFGSAVSRLRVTKVVGRPAGLVLRGTIRRPPEAPTTLAVVTTSDLEWTLGGDCKRGFAIVLQAQVDVGEGDHICRWRQLSADPLGAYSFVLVGDTLQIRPRLSTEFLANPYGCQLRVVTNAGVRTITYPAPGPITEAERAYLERMGHNFVGVCRKIADAITERQVVNWGRDDPIDQLDRLRLWELAVLGLPAEARVILRDARGPELVEAVASASGVVHFMHAFAGVDKPQAVSLETRHIEASSFVVTQRQTVYRRVASLHVRATPTAMAFELSPSAPRLSIRHGEDSALFDLGTPSTPVLVERTAVHSRGPEAQGPVEGVGMTLSEGALENQPVRVRSHVRAPRLGGMRHALVAHQGGRTLLLDQVSHERPRIVQTYPGRAWFEHTVASGRLLARYEEQRCAVDVFMLEGSDGDLEICGRELGHVTRSATDSPSD